MRTSKIITLIMVATLISGCAPPQESAVKDYLNTENPKDRYQTICQSDYIELKHLIAEYKDNSLREVKDITFNDDESTKLDNNYYILATQVENVDGSSFESYYHTVKEKGEWCVDWISHSRTPGFSFDEMYLNGTKGKTGFFRVTLSDYYNYEFNNARVTHYSLRDIDFGKNYYLSKNSPEAEKIFNCVKNAEGYCTISGKTDYPATRRSSSVLLITKANLINY